MTVTVEVPPDRTRLIDRSLDMQQPFTELSAKGCCVTQKRNSGMFARFSMLVLFLLTISCTRAAPAPEPVLGPDATAPTAPVPLAISSGRSWTITPGTQPRRYVSTATTTLELLSDTAVVREVITQRARFTLLTASASGSTSFLGSIDALTIDAGNRVGPTEIPPVFPVTFTGHVTNRIVILDALNSQPRKSATECSDPALSALNVIHRNLVILPRELVQGMTWTDSTSISGCNGPVPVTTLSIRTYRVLGEAESQGRPAILIDRTEKTLSTGEGSQNQHRILITTEGMGAGKIYIDRASGMLLDSEGEQRTDITLRGGRLQRFKQTVRERTTAER